MAEIHHALYLGLQLMINSRCGAEVVGDWTFRLFRRQHEAKFLSSFNKLGLEGLPHAVACAQYHVLSNQVGGVGVEYAYESDRKAWVRFRYPRWMFAGPTLCGLPDSVSEGFLRGWYAQNGVSLNNPNLGFVCVSQDLTAEFGLCGYFQEFDRPLTERERLQFVAVDRPPVFDPAAQPQPPAAAWNAARLAKAERNYAVEYVRNGVCELVNVVGAAKTDALACRAAELIGLQYYATTASALGIEDRGVGSAAVYLTRLFEAMGDSVSVNKTADHIELRHRDLRLVRGLADADSERLVRVWAALWRGALRSRRELLRLEVEAQADELCWKISTV